MDSNTAHSELNVSKDKTSVTHREPPHDTEERFDHYPRILGSDPFASGKHYWEVDVGVKTAWDIGIAQKSVDENTTTAHPNIYWAALRKDEKAYKAVGSNGTTRNLSLSQIPEKVGVYLDCEEQTLSFYNPESQSLLHTAPGISGDLYPLFSPGLKQRGKNLEPLKICPLQNIRGDKVSL